MAEITEDACLRIIASVNKGKTAPLTQWEQYQLAVLWLQVRLGYQPFEIPAFTRDDVKKSTHE